MGSAVWLGTDSALGDIQAFVVLSCCVLDGTDNKHTLMSNEKVNKQILECNGMLLVQFQTLSMRKYCAVRSVSCKN